MPHKPQHVKTCRPREQVQIPPHYLPLYLLLYLQVQIPPHYLPLYLLCTYRSRYHHITYRFTYYVLTGPDTITYYFTYIYSLPYLLLYLQCTLLTLTYYFTYVYLLLYLRILYYLGLTTTSYRSVSLNTAK